MTHKQNHVPLYSLAEETRARLRKDGWREKVIVDIEIGVASIWLKLAVKDNNPFLMGLLCTPDDKVFMTDAKQVFVWKVNTREVNMAFIESLQNAYATSKPERV